MNEKENKNKKLKPIQRIRLAELKMISLLMYRITIDRESIF